MSWLGDLIRQLVVAPPVATAPAAPAIQIGKLTLTGGDVRALGAVASRLVEGAATVSDGEAVADTIIEAALRAAGGPLVATLAAPAAEALAAYIIEGIADGTIHGDPNPMRDAQTQLGRGGQRA
jgi:hypothetical protein